MAGFKIDKFRGLRPRKSAKKLAEGEAVTAQNLKLGSNDLEPIPDKSTTQAVGSGRASRTIYKFDNAGSALWFEWDDYVDVARGPVKDDSLERTYYTGDTHGNGAPKVTTTALADLGNGGPYPEDWRYIGVPAPVTAPTVTKTVLPEDSETGSRLAEQLSVASLLIDQVKWTVYPGTGSRDDVWNLNAAASGGIVFDIQPGTSFRVVSIVSNNRVTLESATEPGITMRTQNSDKTTLNDWQPVDNNGSTQEADWIGWRVPAGMEARIIDHNLNVGDVIVVSALNHTIEFWNALTSDFTESDWAIEQTLDDGGTAFYQVLDAEVTGETYSGEGVWRISGSFYYDVDRAGSVSSELEDRSYVYTYVNSWGEEGPPSPASTALALLDGQSVLLSELALPPTIGYKIENIRIYRTNSTEAGTEFQFVKEIAVARTVRDGVLSKNLGEVLSTTSWDVPDPDMKGIVALPNGMLAGFNGKQLYFCEPYFPHAWPAEYDQAVEYDIVGLAVLGNSLAIMTKGWPSIATGSHPRNMNVRAIKINQACLSKEGIAADGNRVYYPSPDGLVEMSPNGISIKTETLLDPKDWMTYKPATMVGEFYEGRYYGFWDFDVSAVDSVITAELSGTITDADQADVIVGGKTIIITLTNDTWVTAGVAFDAQRQNIINGLTCSTDQTLGWNNVMRDSALLVGHVVRTSDTIVTITLPVETGYAITAEEEVACTIPSTAMLISGSAVICGSTFRIEPSEVVATITLTGTLSGAAEATVVSGGATIIITLVNDVWEATLTDAMKQLIVDGLKAGTNEIDGWNDRVPQAITASSAVVRTNDTVVTVTLPAVPLYSITVSESIVAVVPHSALAVTQNADATSSNSLGIVATGVPYAEFGGTAIASMTENEVVAGAKVLTITLTNDTWVAAGTGPIGTTAQSEALLAAITATTDQTAGWNAQVRDNFVVGDLVRTSPTIATITLGAESAYAIADNETVGATFAAALFAGAGIISASNTFGIQAQLPVTCALTGTITASTIESDIVTGGKTIILTLNDDTWLPAGTGPIGSTANTQAIIDGITSAQVEGTGWNAEVRDNLVPATHVARTSDTICTITLPASASYDTTADETITATIPAAALVISASPVVAAPTFDVSYNPPASAAITGTADDADSDDIIAGSKTIIITLTDDTWVASGAAFNAIRQDIIDGLDAASSPTNGWNNKVRDVIDVTTVVRTNATVVTITLPATADYDVNAAEVVTVTVPASATVITPGTIVASNPVNISAVSANTVRMYVSEDNGAGDDTDGRMHTSFLNPSQWYDYDPAITGGGADEFIWSMAYIPSLSRIVVGTEKAGVDAYIYTSDDDGVSWTERTSAVSLTISAEPRGMFFVDSLDGALVFCTVEPYSVQYSANGISWTDITTAFKAGSGSSTRAEQFFYGDDYVYARTDTGLIRSATLVGAGDVEDNWGDEIDSWAHVGDTNPTASQPAGSTYPAGTGNGKILATYQYSNLVEMQWCYYSHETWFVNSIGVKTLPSSTGKTIQHVVFGNDSWLLVDTNAYGWLCDVTGQAITYDTDPGNYSSLGAMVEGGSLTVANVWYDTVLGFVMVGNIGIGAAEQTKVFTSPTGSTWTERAEFDAESVARGPASADTAYSSASQSQIKGTAYDNVTGVPTEPVVIPILTLNSVTSHVVDANVPYAVNAGARIQIDGTLDRRTTSGGGSWSTQNIGVEWIDNGGATASMYEAKIEKGSGSATGLLSGWSALNTWHDVTTTLAVQIDENTVGTHTWDGTLTIREKADTGNVVSAAVSLEIDNQDLS